MYFVCYKFRDDKRTGQGTYYFLAENVYKGDKYVGTFRNSKKHGQGTFTLPDGEKYVGEFRKGFFHGHGKMTFLSGITSVGVFRKNKEWETLHTKKTGEVTG